MTLADLTLLLALPVLVGLAAFCSGSETALFALTYHDRLRLRRLSPGASAAAAHLLARPAALLVTLMMANTSVTALYFVASSVLLLRASSTLLGVAINAGAVLGLIVAGELMPKLLAGIDRVRVTRLIARPVAVLFRAVTPVRAAIERGIIAPSARLIRAPTQAAQALTVEELSALVALGADQGAIDPEEQRLLAQVVQLGTVRVREVMTPRVRLLWLDAAAPHQRVVDLVRRSRLTRIPVARAAPQDQVLGLLNAKRYLAAAAIASSAAGPGGGPKTPRPTDFLEPVRYVPQTGRLDTLLEHFRRTATHAALCVDEHGAVVGMVRIEDVAQRLVTDLAAPWSGPAADQAVQALGGGRWRVPGTLSVRDWALMFGQHADPRVTTVAGLVQAALGRIPRVGDAVTLGNLRIQVEFVSGNIVHRLVVSLLDRHSASGAITA